MKFIHYCNKIIEYSFYAIFFLVPLVFTNDTSELFELNKMWLTWGLTITVATAWISKMFAEKRIRIQRTPLDIPILLFLLSQIISTIFSMDQRVSLWGYYSRFNGGLLSILSYILLYYAYVTTYMDIKKEHEKPYRFSFWTRVGLIFGGLLIFPIGIALAAPPASDPTAVKSFLLFFGMLTSLVLFFFAAPRDFVKRTFFIIITSAVVVALWGLPSHFGNDPTCLLFRGTFDVTCWTEQFRPTLRMFSTLGQPAWFAAFMASLIPVTMAMTMLRKTKDHGTNHPKNHTAVSEKYLPYLFFAITTLFYVDLLYARTRAGFLAFWVVVPAFWAAIYLIRYLSARTFLTYLAVFTGMMFFFNFIIDTPFPQLHKFSLNYIKEQQQKSAQQVPAPVVSPTPVPIQPTENTPSVTGLDSNITDSGKIREFVWQGAFDAWRAHPIFGTGVETFAYAYYRYRPAGHNLTSEWDFLYNKAHNEYINYLTTTGIFGLGSYLLMIVWFYYLVLKKYLPLIFRRTHVENPNALLTFGLTAGYTTILITNFFGFSVVIMNIFLFFFPLFVLIFEGMVNPEKIFVLPRSAKSAQIHQNHRIGSSAWIGIAGAATIAVFSLLALLTFWNADKAYYWGSNYNKINDFQQAYPKLKEAVDLRGAEPIFQHEFAYTNAAIGAALIQNKDTVNGSQFAQTALKISNDVISAHPNNVVFWKDRVRMMYLLSQVDGQTYLPYALDAIQKAYQLAPTDAKVVYNLGVITGQAGNVPQAIEILNQALVMKPDYRDVYFALGIFYRELATEGGTTVKNAQMQQKAEESLMYILTNLNKDDNPTIQTLNSWGINPNGSTLPASTSALPAR